MSRRAEAPAQAPAEEVRDFAEGAALDGRTVMEVLTSRALKHMTSNELKFVARAGERAQTMAINTGEVLNGLGCLVANDDGVGAFEDSGQVSQLLFMLGEVFNTIAGQLDASNRARGEISRRGGAA